MCRRNWPLPDFAGTAPHTVRLTLRGQVTHPNFLAFLERVGVETLASFDTRDLLILSLVQRQERVADNLRGRLPRLVQLGVLESVGRGRGTQYLLSRRFAGAIGQAGTYTRRKGLDREQNKALLLRHIRDTGSEGAPMAELQQVLPGVSRHVLKRLTDELRRTGRFRLWASGVERGGSPVEVMVRQTR